MGTCSRHPRRRAVGIRLRREPRRRSQGHCNRDWRFDTPPLTPGPAERGRVRGSLASIPTATWSSAPTPARCASTSRSHISRELPVGSRQLALSAQLSAFSQLQPRTTDDGPRTPRPQPIQNPKSVEGHFVLLAENRVGFEIGDYHKTRPLVKRRPTTPDWPSETRPPLGGYTDASSIRHNTYGYK